MKALAVVLGTALLVGIWAEEWSEDSVQKWIKQLKSAHPTERIQAAESLGKLRDPRAVPPLLEALKDPAPAIRKAVLEALSQMDDPRISEAFIAVLKDDNEMYWIRAFVAEHLGKSGKSQAIEPLQAALKAREVEVRRKAADALDQLGWKPKTDAEKAEYLIVKGQWDAAVALGEPALEPLLQALQDQTDWVRMEAAKSLGKLGSPKAVESLMNVFKDRDAGSTLRKAIADALAQIGPPAIEALAASLKEDHWEIRFLAAEALGVIGDPRAAASLTALLKDDHPQVRLTAAKALMKLDDPRALQAVVAVLKDPVESHRIAALEVLAKRRARQAVPAILTAMKDPEPRVRAKAAEVLGMLGDASAVDPLQTALRDPFSPVRSNAAKALTQLGWKPQNNTEKAFYWAAQGKWDACVQLGEDALEALMFALKDKHYEYGDLRYVAKALMEIGNPAFQALLKAVKQQEDDPDSRARAVEVLGIWGNPAAIYAWPDSRPKNFAPDPRVIDPLLQSLKDPHFQVRAKAAQALGYIKDPRVVEPLVAALADWDAGHHAATALERLDWKPKTIEHRVHYFAAIRDAENLRKIWPHTKQVLLNDLRSRDLVVVHHAAFTFITLGNEEALPGLIDALHRRDDKKLAWTCLFCGHPRLQEEAKHWAKNRRLKLPRPWYPNRPWRPPGDPEPAFPPEDMGDELFPVMIFWGAPQRLPGREYPPATLPAPGVKEALKEPPPTLPQPVLPKLPPVTF